MNKKPQRSNPQEMPELKRLKEREGRFITRHPGRFRNTSKILPQQPKETIIRIKYVLIMTRDEEFIQLQIEVPAHVEQKAKRLAGDAGLSISEYFGEIVMKTADSANGAIRPAHDEN